MQNFTFNNNYGCYPNNNIWNNKNESIETITEPQVEAYISNIQFKLGVGQGNKIVFQIPRVLESIGDVVFIQMIKTNQGSRFFQKIFFFFTKWPWMSFEYYRSSYRRCPMWFLCKLFSPKASSILHSTT